MPYEIDQEALDSPNMKILDINKPPVRQMAHQPYPKMVYLHPKDKTKEHRTRVIQHENELEEAMAQGWRQAPHVPIVLLEDLSKDFESEAPEEIRRGPGRPKTVGVPSAA